MNIFNLLGVTICSFMTANSGFKQENPRLRSQDSFLSNTFRDDNGNITGALAHNYASLSWLYGVPTGHTMKFVFIGDNFQEYWNYTYNRSFTYSNFLSDLNSHIYNSASHLSELYYYGYCEYNMMVENNMFLTRYYFVNPSVLGLGTYYFNDVTWNNIYQYAQNDRSHLYGQWINTFYGFDILNSLIGWDTSAGDTEAIDLELTFNDSYMTIYNFTTTAPLGSTYYYSNTYGNIGNSDGQYDSNSYVSFLPFYYFFFQEANDNKFDTIPYWDIKCDIQFSFTLSGSEYDRGYQDGLDQAHKDDESYYESIIEDEKAESYQEGYHDGFLYADNMDSTALTIFTGIIDVGLLPVNVFLGFFNYEIFGINLSGFVASLLTIAIIIIIVRFILGAKGSGSDD